MLCLILSYLLLCKYITIWHYKSLYYFYFSCLNILYCIALYHTILCSSILHCGLFNIGLCYYIQLFLFPDKSYYSIFKRYLCYMVFYRTAIYVIIFHDIITSHYVIWLFIVQRFSMLYCCSSHDIVSCYILLLCSILSSSTMLLCYIMLQYNISFHFVLYYHITLYHSMWHGMAWHGMARMHVCMYVCMYV